jgi:hypothetical protein
MDSGSAPLPVGFDAASARRRRRFRRSIEARSCSLSPKALRRSSIESVHARGMAADPMALLVKPMGVARKWRRKLLKKLNSRLEMVGLGGAGTHNILRRLVAASSRIGRPFPRRPSGPILHLPSARAAMAINGRRNKSFGPGGGTRRLHPSPLLRAAGFGGGEIGSTGDPKDDLSPGMIPPLSGQTYSCE